MFRTNLLFASMLAITACTQPPPQVVLRGQEDFSQGISQHSRITYYDGKSDSVKRQPAPVYYGSQLHTTEQVAKVESIGVTDLAPPAKTAPTKPKEQVAQTLNPWTKKPREAEMVLKQPGSDAAWSAAPKTETKQAFIWPVASKEVVSAFGPQGKGKANDGINIASSEGEPVWAAASGEVVYADNSLKGYGNMVLIKHAGGKTSSYAHLARASVEKYDRVKQGDIIGYVGSSGNVKTPQLYFSMRQGTDAIDPQKLISTSVASN